MRIQLNSIEEAEGKTIASVRRGEVTCFDFTDNTFLLVSGGECRAASPRDSLTKVIGNFRLKTWKNTDDVSSGARVDFLVDGEEMHVWTKLYDADQRQAAIDVVGKLNTVLAEYGCKPVQLGDLDAAI